MLHFGEQKRYSQLSYSITSFDYFLVFYPHGSYKLAATLSTIAMKVAFFLLLCAFCAFATYTLAQREADQKQLARLSEQVADLQRAVPDMLDSVQQRREETTREAARLAREEAEKR